MRDQILETLEPLFERAMEEKKFFKLRGEDSIFSPSELRYLHKTNRFVIGAPNWVLVDPTYHYRKLLQRQNQANLNVSSFRSRMTKEYGRSWMYKEVLKYD